MKLAFEENCIAVDFILAEDGQSAIQLLETTLPTLVLLDIKMPKVDGLEVLAWLRSQVRLCDVPVIVTSSSSAPSDQQRAVRLGATRYWSKAPRFEDAVRFVASLRDIVKQP